MVESTDSKQRARSMTDVPVSSPRGSSRGDGPAAPGQRRSWFARLRPHSILGWVVLSAILAIIIVIPMAYVFYGATRSASIGMPDSVFTWEPLLTILTGPYLMSFAGTLVLGIGVAILSVTGGAVFAWLLSRTDLPGRKGLELVIIGPLFLSPFIGAVAWITLAAPNSGMINVAAANFLGATDAVVDITTTAGIVFIMTLYFLPYGYLFVSSALKGMDPSYEEASYMAGNGVLRTAFRVTLPLIRPALVASLFLITILTIGVFSIPAVLGSRGSFVPVSVLVYRAVETPPSNFALASAIGIGVIVLALIGTLLYRLSLRSASRFTTITARGYRPRQVPIGALKIPALAACIAYGLLAVVLPYFALTIVSLTPYIQTDLTNLTFTTANFETIFGNRRALEALRNTLILGLVAPTVTMALALVVSYVVERSKSRFRRVIDIVSVIPVAVPGIVFATGFVWAYVGTPIYATIWILIFAFVGSYLPHATRMVGSGLIQIDRALEEAGAVNGASPGRLLRRITLPLAMPSVLSGWMLVFILTVREVSTAIMLYSPRTNILPVLTWNLVQDGDMRGAAVVSLMETVILVAVVVLARFVFRVRLTSIVSKESAS
jgi:iron(III) transport system permease protein